MAEEYNNNQIIRKDAKGCFVESLNDFFEVGKMHLVFASYDVNLPSGQRQTNNIHIFIGVDELQEICRKLGCGELQYMLKQQRQSGDYNKPLLEWHVSRETGTEGAEPDRREESVPNGKASCRQKVGFSFHRRQRAGGAECPGADCPAVRRQTGESCVGQYDVGFFE